MAQDTLPLTTFYKGWDVYQQHLIDALAPLSSEQLALRAAAHLRSIGEIATHIIGARARWCNGLMGLGGEEMAALGTWDRPNQPVRSASELVAALQKGWQVLQEALASWTPADLSYEYMEIDQGEQETFSRQWVIWHLIEHDLHHGGELSFSLGMHNLPAPDI